MADTFPRVTLPDGFGREREGWATTGPFAGRDLLDRIVQAPAGEAAAMVLGLPPSIIPTALDALGPREVARMLLGVRADRLDEFLAYIPSPVLSSALAQLSVPQLAELVPLVQFESAVRLLAHLDPDTASALLLELPTQYRQVLRDRLPPPTPSDYQQRAELAVQRATGQLMSLGPGAPLVTEVFGRPVQVIIRDRPGATFGPNDLVAALGAADWRRVVGVVVLTNAALDPGLAAAVREARGRGYLVEVVAWQDERDDGMLKRTLVRFAT